MTGTLDTIKKMAESPGGTEGTGISGEAVSVMRTSTTIEASAGRLAGDRRLVTEGEKLGMDICWVAEAWGAGAPSPLGTSPPGPSGYFSARGSSSSRTRTPAAIARAAITLSQLSEGRFLLASDPPDLR